MPDNVAALEKRIASLESKYNVTVRTVAAVAVIFGVSGAWGGKLLSDAKGQIAQLQTSVEDVSKTYAKYEDALKKAEAAAIANVNSSARDALKREADAQLTGLSNRISNIRSGWGVVSEHNLVVAQVITDHPPYPNLDDHVCPSGYYVTGAVIVNGTVTFQCRQVGIISK